MAHIEKYNEGFLKKVSRTLKIRKNKDNSIDLTPFFVGVQ